MAGRPKSSFSEEMKHIPVEFIIEDEMDLMPRNRQEEQEMWVDFHNHCVIEANMDD